MEDMAHFNRFYTSRAIVAVKDGVLLGIGGVCRVGRQMVVFTDFDCSEQLSRKDVVRAARKVLEIINRYVVVYAYADPTKKTALSFGKHFGFVQTGSSTPDGEILMRVNHGTVKNIRPPSC